MYFIQQKITPNNFSKQHLYAVQMPYNIVPARNCWMQVLVYMNKLIPKFEKGDIIIHITTRIWFSLNDVSNIILRVHYVIPCTMWRWFFSEESFTCLNLFFLWEYTEKRSHCHERFLAQIICVIRFLISSFVCFVRGVSKLSRIERFWCKPKIVVSLTQRDPI